MASINELTYSGLALVTWLRMYQSRTVVKNYSVHILYHSLKIHTNESFPGIQIAKDIVDDMYVHYLRKLRTHMDRKSVGKVG